MAYSTVSSTFYNQLSLFDLINTIIMSRKDYEKIKTILLYIHKYCGEFNDLEKLM